MSHEIRVAIIGPLAPPAGGMAGQTRQLLDLLQADGVVSEVVRTNAPCWPRWIEQARGMRAIFRLLPYVKRLWIAAGRVTVFHVMANSGWAWHLFAAPAVWIAKLRRVRVIVNYRGGGAEAFLARAPGIVRRTLRAADLVAVPSAFLRSVFERVGIDAKVIPNVVDLERFAPVADGTVARRGGPRFAIARNLEDIYDIPTAITAFAQVHALKRGARLTIAGTGPARAGILRQIAELELEEAVELPGALERDAMAQLYRSADVVVNSSIVDNTPNFILEALACGTPVVTTAAGGIPFLVRDRVTALLVRERDAAALAVAMMELLDDEELRERLVRNGLELVQRFSWASVRPMWLREYMAEDDSARELAPMDSGSHRR